MIGTPWVFKNSTVCTLESPGRQSGFARSECEFVQSILEEKKKTLALGEGPAILGVWLLV